MAYQQPPMRQAMLPPAVSSRLNEIFDAIRHEFEAFSQDSSRRDDYEQKLYQAQMAEMQQMQQTFYDLERTHQKIKSQYEDEIMRLRRELESRGIALPPSSIPAAPTSAFPAMTPQNAMQLQGAPGQQQMMRKPGTNVSQQPLSATTQSAQQQQSQYYSQSQPAQQQAGQPNAMPPMQPQQPQQPPQSMARPVAAKTYFFGDIDVDTIPAPNKKEGTDWLAFFNPKLPKEMDIRLGHSFDHNSVVCCTKYSRDGRLLATGCNQIVQIFDISNGSLVGSLKDDTAKEGDLYIRSVCFSPDGQFLATGAEDYKIRIWNLSSRSIKQVLTGHEQDIYSLDFSADGRMLVSGSGDKTVRVWDFATGNCLFKLSTEESGGKDTGITSVSTSSDGRFIAAGCLDRVVRIWDLKSGQLLTKLDGHKDSVYSVAFSPDSQSVVSGSLDKTLKLWDVSSLSPDAQALCKTTMTGHRDFVLSVAFSADNRYILSGSKDRTVQLWDTKGTSHFVLQGHKNSVISVAFSPSGGMFATGSGDCRARVWFLDGANGSGSQQD